MNNIKHSIKRNKNLLTFLIILLSLSIIMGIVYYTLLSNESKELLTNTININSINNQIINNLTKDILLLPAIIVLTLFLIGLPISIFIYFYEGFSLGFTSTILIVSFKLKGFIFIMKYIILFKLISIILLTIYNLLILKLSKNILTYLLKDKSNTTINKLLINFKKIIIVLMIFLLYDLLIYCISPYIFRNFF